MHETSISIRFEDIRTAAPGLADRLAGHAGGNAGKSGSKHRALPEDLRIELLAIRTALYVRGIYDPVLGRFDSATIAQASNEEVAEQLRAIAQSL